jgi:3-dehydro-L-gulonate 2-dehydrogenase
MPRIAFGELSERIERVLRRAGMGDQSAALSARLTAETDRDGVRTHGVARLPRFLEMVGRGAVKLTAKPEIIASFGALERWAGHQGPGNVAAHAAMSRACAIAATNGLGCVALGDTTHWMRAGTYGWLAADLGYAASTLCWTSR